MTFCGIDAPKVSHGEKLGQPFGQEARETLRSLIAAAGMDRDRRYLINEAITPYLEMQQWQIEEIQRAVAEADVGDFATEDEVNAVFASVVMGISPF